MGGSWPEVASASVTANSRRTSLSARAGAEGARVDRTLPLRLGVRSGVHASCRQVCADVVSRTFGRDVRFVSPRVRAWREAGCGSGRREADRGFASDAQSARRHNCAPSPSRRGGTTERLAPSTSTTPCGPRPLRRRFVALDRRHPDRDSSNRSALRARATVTEAPADGQPADGTKKPEEPKK